ncbi:M23 family metallopeptidase [Streptomyces sp. NPDC052042]|uniref:M23 family metallopeptidase n=1 Tax=Streptomyces sp. NPDC052042 TaxID=3365683 RepID=UPI0037D355BD
MNDQHPHAGYAGHGGQATGSFAFDPLFGASPGGHDGTYAEGGYDTGQAGQTGYGASYDAAPWDTGAHQTAVYDAHPPYDTQSQQVYAPEQTYETTATWTPAAYGTAATTTMTATTFADIPAQAGAPDATGQWDTSAWYGTGQWATADTAAYGTDLYGTDPYGAGVYDTGAYDTAAWNVGTLPEPEHDGLAAHTAHGPHEAAMGAEHERADGSEALHPDSTALHPDSDALHQDAAHDTAIGTFTAFDTTADVDVSDTTLQAEGTGHGYEAPAAADTTADMDEVVISPRRSSGRSDARAGGRSRRRSPAKRSALLTVAVPSACVMGVAGIAAASVNGLVGEDKKDDNTTTLAASDLGAVKPASANSKLDTQLANLRADAQNFADRASRTQERIDLRERQAAEKKKRLEEAARREALRPKFVLPVAQHGLSAYYGQAGVNWMSVHTGIDFPVSYGTPVMAATDGTVRTQWNSAYGNMAIVTMADGTETWYCHLSSTRIRSGPVKAGDVIAYSGNSGNSTGPHLHFEVRPGGGAATDPLPWFRSHGVNPT